METTQLFEPIREQLRGLKYDDSVSLDAVRRRADMVIRRVFGPTSKYVTDLSKIRFYPGVYPCSPENKLSSWEDGRASFLNLVATMEEELSLFGPGTGDRGSKPVSSPTAKKKSSATSSQVFVVHGHDDAMKESVARTLTGLGLEPVILHEKPNQGRTIIEKFSDHSGVSFAVVLLSPDDVGRSRNSAPDQERTRARQNVVFELGYFIGKLGRERVVALYREEPAFEMPSDFSGVLFVPFDAKGRWQFDLAKELKASGHPVDANKLL